MGKTHSYGSHMRLSLFYKNKHLMTKRFLSAVLLTLVVFPFNAAEIFTGYDIDASSLKCLWNRRQGCSWALKEKTTD